MPFRSGWAVRAIRREIGCQLKGSLQHFGEFLGWCHPSEGLSRPAIERMRSVVEIGLGEQAHVGAFGKVLAE